MDSKSAALEQEPALLLALSDHRGCRVRDLPRVLYRVPDAHPGFGLPFAGPGAEGTPLISAAVPAAEACDTSEVFAPVSSCAAVQHRARHGSRPADDLHVGLTFVITGAANLLHAGTLPFSDAPLTVFDGERSSPGKDATGGEARRARRAGRSGCYAGVAEARLRLRDVDVHLAPHLPEPVDPVLQRRVRREHLDERAPSERVHYPEGGGGGRRCLRRVRRDGPRLGL